MNIVNFSIISIFLRFLIGSMGLCIIPTVIIAQRIVSPVSENMVDTGMASYYHNKFNGKLTSTGESFNNMKMTAASNTLPLDTYVKVTNLKNGKWIIVRVNDRMNKRNKRLIDLSKNAAEKLGYVYRGLTKVEVKVIPKKFYHFFGLNPGTPLRRSPKRIKK